MEISGARSSWLTRLRNSVRCRSTSSKGARSCIVATYDSTAPSAPRMGVALTSVVTVPPPGTENVNSSARTVSPALNCWTSVPSASATSLPSTRRQVRSFGNSSTGQSGVRSGSAIRLASRFANTSLPVLPSKTTTPTGEVSTSVSRSATCPPLVAVRPGVGDGGGGLRREQHQDLLVGARELVSRLLHGEKELADAYAPVTHRRLQDLRAHHVRREVERPGVGGEVRQPHRGLEAPEMLEEPRPIRPARQFPAFVGREAGGDEVLGRARLVNGRDHPVARAGEGAGAVHDFLEDGVEVEARAEPQDGGAQAGNAFLECSDLPPQILGMFVHSLTSTRPCGEPGSARTGRSGEPPRSRHIIIFMGYFDTQISHMRVDTPVWRR